MTTMKDLMGRIEPEYRALQDELAARSDKTSEEKLLAIIEFRQKLCRIGWLKMHLPPLACPDVDATAILSARERKNLMAEFKLIAHEPTGLIH